MFIPHQKGTLYRQFGTNLYAEPNYGPAIVNVPCQVVHLNKKAQITSVRADSSASRGAAEEEVSITKVLFKTVYPEIGDKFVIDGYELRCNGVEKRYRVTGGLDHYECDFEIWSAT